MIGFDVTLHYDLNLSHFVSNLKSPAKLLQDIQRIRRNSFYKMIADGTQPNGSSVAPLTSAYAAYKLQKWGSRPIRVASGDTIAAYDSVFVGNNQLKESVSSEAAIYLQKGTSKMVARKLLPESWDTLSPSDQQAINAASSEFVDDILRSL